MEMKAVSMEGIVNRPEVDEKLILNAAKDGDAVLLENLLLQKKLSAQGPFVYPRDWKYTFDCLKLRDTDGRTPLHLAASVGNHARALTCVQHILQSIQVLYESEEDGRAEDKVRLLMEFPDNAQETALHLAIENRAPKVVECLLDYNANTLARNKTGVEALDLIYEYVPDALREVYNKCINLKEDHKSFTINWGPIIGLRYSGEGALDQRGTGQEARGNHKILSVHSRETQCIRFLLKSDKWGATLLLHPLVKLYLDLKWKKVETYFWIPFLLQILWLLSYAVLFVDLHLQIPRGESENTDTVYAAEPPNKNASQGNNQHFKSIKDIEVNGVWHSVLLFTIIAIGKEVYQAWVLRRAYLTSESLAQVLFILLFIAQYAIIISRYPAADKNDIIASISAVAIILGTILVIFQLGKTPKFGMQVAAFKKVIYSCTPHLPIFFVWFIGFGLAFWAMFYKGDKSRMIGMLAIIAAMGTGELNAEEHFKKVATGAFTFSELIKVFSIILFVIVIVTLYFNLLIGYAVSDIQMLKTQAEMLQLSNRLSTIFTIEAFLLSTLGRNIVFLKCKLQNILGTNTNQECNYEYFDSIYVVPPSDFPRYWGIQELKFDCLNAEQLNAFKEIAFDNIIKNKKESALQFQRLVKMLEPSDKETETLIENTTSTSY